MNDWDNILRTSYNIMKEYDTGVTLRQLFYRLVSVGLLENTKSTYTALSNHTAKARREGWFPSFIDKTRIIETRLSFNGVDEAKLWLFKQYRRDRTENQKFNIYLGVEKAGIVEQLKSWFWKYGVNVIALRGYSSQTFVDDITADIERDGRLAVLIYAGDFDPSGVDIIRDFKNRCHAFEYVLSVALTQAQITEYNLPEMMGKTTDSRAQGFINKTGKLVQVELDALEPSVLRRLYEEQLMQLIDLSIYEEILEAEKLDLERLIS